MSDEPDRLVTAPPTWNDAMRRLRELAAQMTAAAQAVAVAGAKATPPVLAQPLAWYTDQLLAVSAAMTTPLRRLLDEQERLVALMAELGRAAPAAVGADRRSGYQQRRMSEQMVELARPFLDQSAMLESCRPSGAADLPTARRRAGRGNGGEEDASEGVSSEEVIREEDLDAAAVIGQASRVDPGHGQRLGGRTLRSISMRSQWRKTELGVATSVKPACFSFTVLTSAGGLGRLRRS